MKPKLGNKLRLFLFYARSCALRRFSSRTLPLLFTARSVSLPRTFNHVELAWQREAQRRLAELERGEVTCIPLLICDLTFMQA